MEAQPGSMRVGVLAGGVVITSLATGRRVTMPSHWGAHLEAGLDPVPARLWSSNEFADVITRTDVRYPGTRGSALGLILSETERFRVEVGYRPSVCY
jgi:hypothetical protein